MTELLDAVDDLTLPKPVKVHTDTGHTWATEDALLVQLEDAVASGLGSAGGGSSTPWARNVLNTDALHTAAMITAQIGDWCRMVKAPTTRNATVDLRSWFAAFTVSEGASLDAFYVRKLREWAGQIRGLLNPPRVMEMISACPACLEDVWVNDEGAKVPHPVVVHYRPNSGLQDTAASCRACGHEWVGEWALRALRHDIDGLAANVEEI